MTHELPGSAKNEGDWELFGHIKATPIRRPESKCCDELKRRIKELERTLAEHVSFAKVMGPPVRQGVGTTCSAQGE